MNIKKKFFSFISIIRVIVSFFLLLPLLTACSVTSKENQISNTGKQYQKYSITNYSALNTVSEISSYAIEDQQEQLEELNNLLEEWNKLFDIYKNYDGIHNIKTINDYAGKEPVEVDQRIISVLKKGIEIEKLTNGTCNIAFGSVLSIWHHYREKGLENEAEAQVPTKKELKKAARHTDISNLIIDEKKGTVYLKDPDMSLDLGAIAKGCAGDDIARRAKELGMDSVMINLGGNVLTIGNKKSDENGTDWIAGIQNPDNANELSYLFKLKLNDRALVTSGDYQRFYEVDGKKYSHIIDPLTLFPPEKYRSVTVYMESSGMADALSTSLFIADLEEGKELISEIEGECEVIWVLQDGSVEMTEGIKGMVY